MGGRGGVNSGSSMRGAVDESTGLSRVEIGGRSYVEGCCPGRERFLVAARLFWNQALTVFVSLNWPKMQVSHNDR